MARTIANPSDITRRFRAATLSRANRKTFTVKSGMGPSRNAGVVFYAGRRGSMPDGGGGRRGGGRRSLPLAPSAWIEHAVGAIGRLEKGHLTIRDVTLNPPQPTGMKAAPQE